ncbi:SAF domain-containing protein [Nocardiopsis sp. HUAS JQ3]|uniref:SAF domain-containing protein n=1 Tax=Nocardiopsis sp. HUAS JQ3 TaxID=3061629 RepID=UPI0023A9F287|nr:SAF domain-containing protein [Nocardiopsis sp. HUAS JQ3]WDZ90576.1 SAF domain-containing protein [Nocardiopsis sp. HUAS JQ3]
MRLATVSRRRWKWGLLAGVLIASGGMAGAWAGLASQDTRTVAVLVADLPAGHMITSGDVTPVDLEKTEGLRLLTPQVAEGMVLTKPVPAGSPLVAGSVADSALWPEPGQAVLAVPVTTLPRDLTAGTTVDLVPTGATPGEATGDEDTEAEEPTGEPGVVTGLVHRVVSDGAEDLGVGQQVVEMVLPRDQVARFSQAAAGGDVQVVVVNPHEEVRTDAAGEGRG